MFAICSKQHLKNPQREARPEGLVSASGQRRQASAPEGGPCCCHRRSGARQRHLTPLGVLLAGSPTASKPLGRLLCRALVEQRCLWKEVRDWSEPLCACAVTSKERGEDPASDLISEHTSGTEARSTSECPSSRNMRIQSLLCSGAHKRDQFSCQ